MESWEKAFRMEIPAGWKALVIRTVLVAVVAFVVLQIKELVDAGRFDTAGTSVDALLVAAGVLLLNVILMLATRGKAAEGIRRDG
jgi:hypothetical protein